MLTCSAEQQVAPIASQLVGSPAARRRANEATTSEIVSPQFNGLVLLGRKEPQVVAALVFGQSVQ